MQYFSFLSLRTRVLTIITAIFLLYGYLCRFAGLYFFWESKSIGWVLFFVTLLSFLLDRIKKEKARNGKAVGEKIGVAVQALIVLSKCFVFIVIPYTDTYSKAVNYIRSNEAIQSETGGVKSIFFMPYGKTSEQHNNNGMAARAEMYFVVKGADKYIDLHLSMGKDVDSDWQIMVNE